MAMREGTLLIGPGLATWDFSVMKNTTIHERLNLQFRAEIFNLLDRANFNTPQRHCCRAACFGNRADLESRCGTNHQHFDHCTPGAVRPKAPLVNCRRRAL